jgi:sialate O-acetylesterase
MNGVFIGFYGTFPPKYISAYNVSRKYPIPAEVLHSSGDNVIAVRVFDNELGGGIARGPVGIFVGKEGFRPDVPFPSAWKFSPEDDDQWKNPGFNDDSWVSVRVPGWWETQGFKGHDGFAWYRVRFRVPPSLASQSLILLVGKIDDYDETFLNGQKVGRTGPMPVGAKAPPLTKDYSLVRAYPIPAGSLLTDSDNVLAVRVYDVFMHGGIYEGPIGLVTREHYLAGKNVKGVNRPWWSKFWEYFIR